MRTRTFIAVTSYHTHFAADFDNEDAETEAPEKEVVEEKTIEYIVEEGSPELPGEKYHL